MRPLKNAVARMDDLQTVRHSRASRTGVIDRPSMITSSECRRWLAIGKRLRNVDAVRIDPARRKRTRSGRSLVDDRSMGERTGRLGGRQVVEVLRITARLLVTVKSLRRIAFAFLFVPTSAKDLERRVKQMRSEVKEWENQKRPSAFDETWHDVMHVR